MGFDGDYSTFIANKRKKPLKKALENHFKDVMNEGAKSFVDIADGKGVYDFFGHKAYIDIPPADELYAFHELIGSKVPVHKKESIVSIYDNMKKDIADGYKKLKEHKAVHKLYSEEPITIHAFVIPILSGCNGHGHDIDPNHVKFAIDKNIFHELCESTAKHYYGPMIGSIFANAVSNIVGDKGSCGTELRFHQDETFSIKPGKDEINFNKIKNAAKTIPEDRIDDFLFNVLDMAEINDNNFSNIILEDIV